MPDFGKTGAAIKDLFKSLGGFGTVIVGFAGVLILLFIINSLTDFIGYTQTKRQMSILNSEKQAAIKRADENELKAKALMETAKLHAEAANKALAEKTILLQNYDKLAKTALELENEIKKVRGGKSDRLSLSLNERLERFRADLNELSEKQ